MVKVKTLQIHRATLEDIPIIQAIARATWPVAYGHIISAEQIEYMLDMMYSTDALVAQMTTKQHVFLLAFAKDVELGFAGFEVNAQRESAKTKLHKLYCDPRQQKMGVGAALVHAVDAAARAANQKAIVLNVNKKNNAIGFYQRRGFQVVKEVVVDIGQGFLMDDFVMEKPLF